jgi:hypothetical protein
MIPATSTNPIISAVRTSTSNGISRTQPSAGTTAITSPGLRAASVPPVPACAGPHRLGTAGEPAVREIAAGIGRGVISYTTVHNMFSGPRVPKWGYLELVVEQLNGDVEAFRRLWSAARRAESASALPVPPKSATTEPEPPDDGGRTSAVREFAILGRPGEKEFYDHLIQVIRQSKEIIYLTGYGFQDERKRPLYRRILRAEEEALKHGVKIVRIQTGSRVTADWAEGYAQLQERYPEQLSMFVDFDSALFNDVGLFDPRGHSPRVDVLFESRESDVDGARRRPIFAFFVEGDRGLAAGLADQFVSRLEAQAPLTADDIRGLARTYLYFRWGVHMATRQIRLDVPDARRRGVAILRGWRRDIRAVLAGPADRASIERTDDPDDFFDGVAYDLSWWGKTRLDRREERAYSSIDVVVEINGVAHEAFTYIPLPKPEPDELPGRDSAGGLR